MTTIPETCTGCGLCCRYPWSGISSYNSRKRGIPLKYRYKNHPEYMHQSPTGICAALDRRTNLCRIYSQRPDVCRGVQRGDEWCVKSIQKKEKPGSA